MRKNILLSTLKWMTLAVFLAMAVACHRDATKQGTTDAAAVPQQYDVSLKADKDGQFDLNGATLSAEDLRGHIRYRNENGQPVHTIFLERGEKEKITNVHIAGLAGIARDLKIQAFVKDNDGKLKLISIQDQK